MTIQQMLLGGGAKKPPVYVGSTYVLNGSGSALAIATPTDTKAGDFLFFYACSTNNANHTWSMAEAVTELYDAGTYAPNGYGAYAIAVGDGARTYTLSASKSARLRGGVIVYRNAKFSNNVTHTQGTGTSATVAINVPEPKSAIVGLGATNGAAMPTVSNTPTVVQSWDGGQPAFVALVKDDVQGAQSFTFSGLNSGQPFDCILVALAPA